MRGQCIPRVDETGGDRRRYAMRTVKAVTFDYAQLGSAEFGAREGVT
jgi:hypothetical protein